MKKVLLVLCVAMASVCKAEGGYLSRIFHRLCFVNKYQQHNGQQESSEHAQEAFRQRWALKYADFMVLRARHTKSIESCSDIFFETAITSSTQPIVRNMHVEHEVSESIDGMLKETMTFHDKGAQTPLQVAIQKEEEVCALFPGGHGCLAARRITDLFRQLMQSNDCPIDRLPEVQALLARRR